MNSIATYFKGIAHEMKTVAWPSPQTIIGYTVAVIVISFFCGYFMGIFDVVFEKLLQLFVNAF